MPKLANNLDANQLEIRNPRAHILSAAPGSPVTGQFFYNSTTNRWGYYNGTSWVYCVDTYVTSVGGTSPINSSGGTTPTISIDAASGSGPGSMSSAHYTRVNNATNANTVSTLVLRDSNGDFAARNITANLITGLATPTGSSDAATKGYVDGLVNGLDWKNSARVASTANVNTASAPSSIDDVTLTSGDRVLLKDQSTASQNGVYTFASAGAALTRAADADASAEVTPGFALFIEEGTANGNTAWILTTDGPITVGSTSLTFAQFGAGASYTGSSSITISSNVISINATYAGQTSITTLGTITTGTWNGTTIAVANGGTGATSAATARSNLGATGKYTATIGDGSSTSIAVTQGTHGLAANGSMLAMVYDASTGDQVITDVSINNSNGTVTFTFAVAPTSNQYRIVIVG